MKVAAVQFAPVFKATERNLRTAAELVGQAVEAGAQLIVLPELCLTGYSFLSKAEAMPFAEDLSAASRPRSLEVFGGLAKSLGVAIAWGTVEKDPHTGHLYNSQVLVTGQNHWVCRKLNRWANDLTWAKPGTDNPPVGNFMGKKIGLLICADVRDKSDDIAELYEPGDADIVAFSSNWGDGGFPSGRWVQFAEQNKCTLVVSNRYGKEENNNFGEGGICVITPEGDVLCEGLRWNQPCIVYADVP